MSVKWKKVSGANSYSVYIQYPGSSSLKKVITTTSNTFTLTNMKKNTKYRINVIANKKVNGKNWTSASNPYSMSLSWSKLKNDYSNFLLIIQRQSKIQNDCLFHITTCLTFSLSYIFGIYQFLTDTFYFSDFQILPIFYKHNFLIPLYRKMN